MGTRNQGGLSFPPLGPFPLGSLAESTQGHHYSAVWPRNFGDMPDQLVDRGRPKSKSKSDRRLRRRQGAGRQAISKDWTK